MNLQRPHTSLFPDDSCPPIQSNNHPMGYINAPKLSGNNQSRYEKAKRIKARWANGKIRVSSAAIKYKLLDSTWCFGSSRCSMHPKPTKRCGSGEVEFSSDWPAKRVFLFCFGFPSS